MFEFITPMYVFLIFSGTLVGIIFGAIPGMTATMAVAVCLPLTYSLGLDNGLALLLGLYVGGISGGLVPAILLGIPGTPSSITTTFDGYPMAQRGEGEKALRIGIVASLVGGLISLAALFFFAPALAEFAIKFSYVEKFLIILFALTVMAALSEDMLMGIFSGFLGIFISLIGVYDVTNGGNGEFRLIPPGTEYWLEGGFSLLPVLIGLFGLATILEAAEAGMPKGQSLKDIEVGAHSRFSRSVFKGQIGNLVRSSGIGTFVGILPGVGGSAASILSYTATKTASKNPESFGKGNPAGIMASESGNNGLTGGAMVPLLSLGIPGDATTALLIGAFTLQGIQVGPLFIGNNPGTWSSIVIAMLIANIAMFAIMYFAIRWLAMVVAIPKHILFPVILMMCVIGAYTINYGIMFDVWTLLIFGVAGWLFTKIGIEVAPFIIGFILGPAAEIYFVKSLESFGTLSIFFTKSWIAVLLWVLIAGSVAGSVMLARRKAAMKEAEG
ncbi:MAG TPA: tripartite tricarboxylate transporter permease [Paracoccus sp. (in: a-proteobacteria)]|uniref:tripartite tricarboxylate transporter permease n=1 Tax=uncultured Paracoccus sp. TaxID=189685 RepID=UPI00260EB609|nr:tripartite tricarboxylate transporter permease [uncultured Paracoccus sp.]HMQ39695.1 tripartite tricarboxylate transporter permease [Paracoccus sp. (in: a-proteobacteria)]HMR34831.1 tripartite tricarboxylate transporter permease [Paracoccus sp. (in: a-proteobacteria)]